MVDGATGGADRGDITAVQGAGSCKYAVGVCDDEKEAGGAGDGAAGAAGRSDIRGFHLAGSCKHAVGVCDNGKEAGERVMELLEGRAEAISGEFTSQNILDLL